MVTLKQIEEFLSAETIAMAGVSRNPKKFGYAAFKELKEKGMNVIPVNPNADEIFGSKVCREIKDLPQNVGSLIVMTNKKQTAEVVKQAREKGIKNIWIQQMAETKEALKELEGSDVNLITKECILMHYKPHSIHKFHRAIKKLFRLYPS
jgi:predicted CoA-binding protein